MFRLNRKTNLDEQKLERLYKLQYVLSDYRLHINTAIIMNTDPFLSDLEEFIREPNEALTLDELFKNGSKSFDISNLNHNQMKALFEIYQGLETAVDFSKFTFKSMFFTIKNRMRDSYVSSKTLDALIVYIKEQKSPLEVRHSSNQGYGATDMREESPVTSEEARSENSDDELDLMTFDSDLDESNMEVIEFVPQPSKESANILPGHIWQVMEETNNYSGLVDLLKFGYTVFKMDPQEIDPTAEPTPEPTQNGYTAIL